MKNNIMQTINKMYKSNPTLEEIEISKLESLLTQVGVMPKISSFQQRKLLW